MNMVKDIVTYERKTNWFELLVWLIGRLSILLQICPASIPRDGDLGAWGSCMR